METGHVLIDKILRGTDEPNIGLESPKNLVPSSAMPVLGRRSISHENTF